MAKAKRKHSTRITRPDPALAGMDNHRKLDRMWLDLARLEEMDSPGVTRCDVDRAHAAAEEAALKLAETKSTTVAGAAAMLAYITTGPITGLFELGETNWHETAFRAVVASLAELAEELEAERNSRKDSTKAINDELQERAA